MKTGHSPAAVTSNESPCECADLGGVYGKANRVTGEGEGEAGLVKEIKKLGVRTPLLIMP